jgi:hypothetical protein
MASKIDKKLLQKWSKDKKMRNILAQLGLECFAQGISEKSPEQQKNKIRKWNPIRERNHFSLGWDSIF